MKPNHLPENAFEALVLDLTPRYGRPEARSIARIVFEDAFGAKHVAEKIFSPEEETRFLTIRQRLLDGEPVQYVLGQADFFGLKFKVSPAVLIPRQETEELVDWAFQILKNDCPTGPRVLDVGAGSGCIAVTLKWKLPSAEVWASDLSEEALEVARSNAEALGAAARFFQNDILDRREWAQFPDFEMIVSNPPYIPRREEVEMPSWVKDHEPHLALFVMDEKPLIFYETIADFALEKLSPGGFLLFECNEFNAKKVHHLLLEKGFHEVEMRLDLFGKQRMVKGQKGRSVENKI